MPGPAKVTARKRSLPAARLVLTKIRVTAGTADLVKRFHEERQCKPADAWRQIIFAGTKALNLLPSAA